jgi:hypothetical protein
MVEASIASLKVTDITLLRETLVALAAGLFAVTEGVVGDAAGVGESSFFLQPAINNTAAVANTEIIFVNFIILVFCQFPLLADSCE